MSEPGILDLTWYLGAVEHVIKSPPARGDRVQMALPLPRINPGEPIPDQMTIRWAEIGIESNPRGPNPTFTTQGPVRIDLHELDYWLWKRIRGPEAARRPSSSREDWMYERLRTLEARNQELEAALRQYAGWSQDNSPALGGNARPTPTDP